MQRIQAGRKQGELALYLDSPMMGDALNVTTGESWREKNFKSEMCRKVRGSATKRMECLLIPPPVLKVFVQQCLFVANITSGLSRQCTMDLNGAYQARQANH
jgi:hypothetical protein